jgi:Fe-S cluster assembly iron-binding protein IscA
VGGIIVIKLSDTAKEKFVEFLAEEKKENAHVRIYVSGVG